MTTIWQIGSGVQGRRYDDLCLEHDLMIMGPGDLGPYDRVVYDAAADEGRFTKIKLGGVRQFATKVRPGDRVVLRAGGYEARAIGIVADEGYAWREGFDDVYGWDLQHTCRVIWQRQHTRELAEIQKKRKLFEDRKQIPTFTRVNDLKVLAPIQHLLDKVASRPLRPLPEPVPAPLTLEQVAEALFEEGLSHEAIHRVRDTLARLRRLAGWYRLGRHSPGRPTEHEVVAHVVIPMLGALGWSEQLLAVEWKKIDLAVFARVPTSAGNCRLICEAKVLGTGMQAVLEQAAGYVEKHKLRRCHKIVLTDGGRFYLHVFGRRHWSERPVGYLNIEKIRRRHLLPGGTDAIKTIMELTPARVAGG